MKKVIQLFKRIFFKTYTRGFFFSYFFAILIGAFLLSLPFSVQAGQSLSLVDAIFTAASALSVTGLTTIVVGDVFTPFGLVVLLFIIQFGGIGLIMMIAMFWLIARKKVTFTHRNMIMTDQNQISRKGIVRFIRNVLIMIFVIEAIGFVVISSYLYTAGYFNVTDSLFQALFLTISLTANAGFDIAPNADSYQMFSGDFFMQTVGILLMFFGSVGFWVLAEVKEFIFAKLRREKFKFSYFVKMIVRLHIIFIILGALLIFALELRLFFADKSLLESIYYSFFMSVTTRNAGFSTMDINDFSTATTTIIMLWMFIGASPNSVGGGIRTTSIFLILLSIKAFATGKDKVIYKNRKIKEDTVQKAYIALVAGMGIVLSGIVLLSIAETAAFHDIVFEVTSAFGTTGLSTGITSTLTVFSRIVLIFIMFIGRLGILAFVLMFRSETSKKVAVSYPEEDVIVG